MGLRYLYRSVDPKETNGFYSIVILMFVSFYMQILQQNNSKTIENDKEVAFLKKSKVWTARIKH